MSKGVVFGFLSATYSVNGLKMPKEKDSPYVNVVDMYGKSRSASANEFLSIVRNIKSMVDVLVVAFHYGDEYTYEPSVKDRKYLHDMAESGADLIIGHHPHVLHGSEDYINKDGRQTFIMYSLGNYISAQARYFRRRDLSYESLRDCTEVRTTEGMVVMFDLVYRDGKCSFINKSIVPFFNVEFVKNNKVGYRIVPLARLTSDDFYDSDISSIKNFDILRQIASYRYSTISDRVGMPLAEFF